MSSFLIWYVNLEKKEQNKRLRKEICRLILFVFIVCECCHLSLDYFMLQFLVNDRSLKHDKDFFKKKDGRWILRQKRFAVLFGNKGILLYKNGRMFVRPATQR